MPRTGSVLSVSRTSLWSHRNPPASLAETRHARRVARLVARECVAQGATAVILAGSWARGDARRFSDLDVWSFVTRRKPSSELGFVQRRGFLVSIMETTPEAEVKAMRDPARAGRVVLAWREAIPIWDPRGAAARVQRRALSFTWDGMAGAADKYVASELVGWAEEVVKLTRLVADHAFESAAVQRNLLANRMAGLVAVQKRMLYRENGLWEAVGGIMGRRWRAAQRAAFGVDRRPFTATCDAALELYRLTAEANLGVLRPRDREIVSGVCAAVGHPLRGERRGRRTGRSSRN